MSKIKNPFAGAALAIFEAHSKIEEIYITSDGQGFTDEEKAKDQARYLKDRTIEHFARGFEDSYTDADEIIKDAGVGTEEREALVKEYEELFGEKPAHNIGIPKLTEKIAAKKTELADPAKL